MKSLLIMALCILTITLYQNSIDGNDSYNESLKLNKASLFLNYTTAFDNYYLSNANVTGDVTSNVILPVWIPKDSFIKMYVNGGYGYVYMPSEKGVISELMKITDYSALIGVTDRTSIVTITGKVAKPSFIPEGYIVYMR
ncbi:type IV pilus biogenesis protein PilM [Escherichia coli]|nr:type IV pilus biogenesis protein PilM [Escherichia coli]MDY8698583.1 type IV pilus biogenesis protein PilM [Escherichia coli]MDY8725001.1 type IV pilus biogenesis protein PilM [Escherichia coli]MDY8846246.1 type IV pilus biogenesis protein PilM [Escherichia coli]